MRFSSVILLACLAVPGPVTTARAACDDCADRYVEMAEGRRLQAKIDYLLPGDPLDLDRRQREKEEEEDEKEAEEIFGYEQEDFGWLVASILVLGGIAFLVYLYGGGGLVTLGRKPGEGRADGPAPDPATLRHDDLPRSATAFLSEIEAMADRREALRLLSERMLMRAADEAGIRPRRSWTAREALRALPRSWRDLADLRHLTREAELAWFGGRSVTDGVFEDCIARARAMLGAPARAAR